MGNFSPKVELRYLLFFGINYRPDNKSMDKNTYVLARKYTCHRLVYIYFTENNGMAFGMEILGKLFLTSFRIVAVTIIGWFLYKFVKQGVKTGFIICISLILTGALGNIIDSVFYGVLFNESTHSQIASFLPEGGGYASLFYGKVVDMFYFPIIDTNWPPVATIYRWTAFYFL